LDLTDSESEVANDAWTGTDPCKHAIRPGSAASVDPRLTDAEYHVCPPEILRIIGCLRSLCVFHGPTECSNFQRQVLADGAVIVQAQTIELLCKKGGFSTEQAVILAEAIDMGIDKAQLVTVPIMDARFAEMDARFAKVDARFVEVNARIDSNFAVLNGKIDSKIETLSTRLDGNFTSVNARMDSLQAKIELKMQRWAVLMILAMLAGQTALGPIGMEAFSSLRQALSTLVR
jgi:hypothetical protein